MNLLSSGMYRCFRSAYNPIKSAKTDMVVKMLSAILTAISLKEKGITTPSVRSFSRYGIMFGEKSNMDRKCRIRHLAC